MIRPLVDSVHSALQRRRIRAKNRFVPYPQDWDPYYNGQNEPCDMLQGPCSCGSWHYLYEWEIECE